MIIKRRPILSNNSDIASINVMMIPVQSSLLIKITVKKSIENVHA